MTTQRDLENIKKSKEIIEEKSLLLDKWVNELVEKYSQDLDKYIDFVKKILSDPKNPPSDIELDDFILNIPTFMYYVGSYAEFIGIRDDMSKIIKEEMYSNVLIMSEGTVQDKKAEAVIEVVAEDIMNVVYKRAYKILSSKLNIALELIQSIKKVISRRMQERELSRTQNNSIKM